MFNRNFLNICFCIWRVRMLTQFSQMVGQGVWGCGDDPPQASSIIIPPITSPPKLPCLSFSGKQRANPTTPSSCMLWCDWGLKTQTHANKLMMSSLGSSFYQAA